jgi:folate-dependent phosphoribosylglycinamide formyltransferase PurN
MVGNNRKKIIGLTLHEVTTEVDTGPIIDQIAFPIGPDESWCKVYERCRPDCYYGLYRALQFRAENGAGYDLDV